MGDKKIQKRGPVHSWACGQTGFSFPKTKGSASGLQEGAEAEEDWKRPGGAQAGQAGLGRACPGGRRRADVQSAGEDCPRATQSSRNHQLACDLGQTSPVSEQGVDLSPLRGNPG